MSTDLLDPFPELTPVSRAHGKESYLVIMTTQSRFYNPFLFLIIYIYVLLGHQQNANEGFKESLDKGSSL